MSLRDHLTRLVLSSVFTLLSVYTCYRLVADLESSYAGSVALVAHGYCRAPERLRAAFRELIDAEAAPYKIRVECAADAL